jgi:ribosomal protein L34E
MHDPIEMVFASRSNRKHAHNTPSGVRYRNHWHKVYRCPTCGRQASGIRKPRICRGQPKPKE